MGGGWGYFMSGRSYNPFYLFLAIIALLLGRLFGKNE